ncbi:unnamed protein product [Chironomus riparius]|uniref:Orn/DAP/Arg decarboxylase 2 N-terminal domain-containing protein n=1 Tax=Chironomus riparius TaxID=315576 RepID=A0A9N9RTE7_9DIPT|nr:unnamed protein product [Chironomus riparius]
MSKFPRSKVITESKLIELSEKLNSPFWAYDGNIIKDQINKLRNFDVIRYAQKACSNINILKLVKECGTKIDSVSFGEIERALQSGFVPGTRENEIVYTADIIDNETCERVLEMNIPVNAGSIDMLRELGRRNAINHPIWIRINPGFGDGHSKKTNTGGENSKHGIWFEDLPEAINVIKENNLKLIGFHMHIGSGLFSKNFDRVSDAMADHVIACNQDIEAISTGGGIPIAYKENEIGVDVDNYFSLWDAARKKIEKHFGHSITLEVEPGRFLVAESGILVCKVHAVKTMGSKKYVLVNAGFNDLMRPTMYGSYHHITVLGDTTNREVEEVVIAGHLCESGDVFTQVEGGIVITRLLPKMYVGDYLVFHDVGAYGASMSSNYNSRPLLPEVLFIDDEIKLIRRRQTVNDLIQLEMCVDNI